MTSPEPSVEMGGDPLLLCDIARDQLTVQSAAGDTAEAKTGIYFGVGSTLVGILVAIIAFRPPNNLYTAALAGLAAAIYIALTGVCLLVFRQDKWYIGPDLRILAERWPNRSVDLNKWTTVQTLITHYDHNEKPYNRKLRRVQWAARLLAAETVAIGLFALFLAAWGPL
jgi:hypothetical protein